MSRQSRFEFSRWSYFFLFLLIVMGVGVFVTEYAIGPVLQRVFDEPFAYQWPTSTKILRMILLILFTALFAGTVCWFYDKKASGR
jgi:hypothetical protein